MRCYLDILDILAGFVSAVVTAFGSHSRFVGALGWILNQRISSGTTMVRHHMFVQDVGGVFLFFVL